MKNNLLNTTYFFSIDLLTARKNIKQKMERQRDLFKKYTTFLQQAIESQEKVDNISLGENGHPQLAALNSNLVASNFSWVRNAKVDIGSLLVSATPSDIRYIVLLAFYQRNCRGIGKGEKKISYEIFLQLMEHFPALVFDVLPLIPEFGYYKDWVHLLEMCDSPKKEELGSKITELFGEQIKKDLAMVEEWEQGDKKGPRPPISNAAKYFPSSGKKGDKTTGLFDMVAKFLFPVQVGVQALEGKTLEQRRKAWCWAKGNLRSMITRLRSFIGVAETFQCSGKYTELFQEGTFVQKGAKWVLNNSHALLNEIKGIRLTEEQDETGNRYPESPDRVECRQKYLKHLVEKGISGKTLMIHELVEKVLSEPGMSKGIRIQINAQYNSLIEDIVKTYSEVDELAKAQGLPPPDRPEICPLSDVSGSMNGTPMHVSIGMGIVGSDPRIASPECANLVLTFETQPRFHSLVECKDFVEKVHSLQKAPWGGSTNFHLALDLIKKVVVDNGWSPERVKALKLIVVSDMQFNAACAGSPWDTAYDLIRKSFAENGYEPPTIVFINARASTGYPCDSDEPGTMLLSGWNPSIFKFLLTGEMEKEEEVVDESGEVRQVKRKVTPEEALQQILDNQVFDPVREVLDRHMDGIAEILESV